MNGREFAEMISWGVRPVVVFTHASIDVVDGYFQTGMRARAVSAITAFDDMTSIYFDGTEFADYNRQFERDESHPCEYIYIGNELDVDFIAIEDSARVLLYKKFSQSDSKSTYVEWLEDLVISSSK